jgi:hypothetical protein
VLRLDRGHTRKAKAGHLTIIVMKAFRHKVAGTKQISRDIRALKHKRKKRSEDVIFKLETQFVRDHVVISKVEPHEKTERALPPIVREAIKLFDGRLVLDDPNPPAQPYVAYSEGWPPFGDKAAPRKRRGRSPNEKCGKNRLQQS